VIVTSDLLGHLLGFEAARAEDHLADDVVDDLVEAGHVRPLLLRPEIDEAVEAGVIELLRAARADAGDLLDVRHSDARQRHPDRRFGRLHVRDLHGLRSVSAHYAGR
jgi:hypothetical protein